MTDSKIRNFLETLRSIKEDALTSICVHLNLLVQTDQILNFRTLHFKRSIVYFCFKNRLY